MRLGILGPAAGHVGSLRELGEFLRKDQRAERIVYLGGDDVFDRSVQSWAAELVGGDPTERGLWQRASEQCLEGNPGQIDGFVRVERERAALRIFESISDESTRLVEMLAGALVVMIWDKGSLDEEDMLPAGVLVFGRSDQPVVKQVGRRWFVAPGSLNHAGVLVLDEDDEGIRLVLFDRTKKELSNELLATSRGVRMRVSGAEG